MPVLITIDSRVRFGVEALSPAARHQLRARATHVNPGKKKLTSLANSGRGRAAYAMRAAAAAEPAEITVWRQEGDEFSVPRGMLAMVREVLQGDGLTWTYADERSKGDSEYAFGAWPETKACMHVPDRDAPDGGTLRPYQQAAIAAAIERQNCIIRAPTGSGKTTTLIGIIAAVRLPTLVVLDSTELVRQWTRRIERELGVTDVGLIGGGDFRIRPITIAMRQSLTNLLDPTKSKLSAEERMKFRERFGLVVVDEVHRAAAATFMTVVDKMASFYRVGASADETRADEKEFLVYDLFGDVAHSTSQDELIADGSVLDVECRIVPTEFCADWYVRARDEGKRPDFNRLLDEMTTDEARNALIVGIARGEIDAGEPTLVLTHRVAHARAIAKAIDGGVMIGGPGNEREKENAVDAMRAGQLLAGAATLQSMGTGVDLPLVGRGIIATPIGNNRQQYGQVRGRFCRPADGKIAIVYVLWDQHVQGAAAVERLIRWNRSTLVYDGAEWVPAKQYLHTWKSNRKESSR